MKNIAEHLYGYFIHNGISYSEFWVIIPLYSINITDHETIEGKQTITFKQDHSELHFYDYEEIFTLF